MVNWDEIHLTVVAKMSRANVSGKHHKQEDTIVNWCSKYDGDEVRSAIDDLVRKPEGPVHRTARDTIKLHSIAEAEQFLEDNDDSGQFTWYY